MTRSPLFAPFPGWLIKPEWASRVIAGAYDSKTPEERRRIVAENPVSYLGVTRSHEDLLPDDPASEDDLLDRGAGTLSTILRAAAFAPTGHETFYVYRLTEGDHQQTGVVGALAVEGLRDGRVLMHENVRPARARLLARHLQRVGATSPPVALAQRADPEVSEVLQQAATGPPLVDHLVEGVRHQVWTVDAVGCERIVERLSDEVVYLTDGHHRSAAAVAGADDRPDDPAFQRTLAVLFPDDHLNVEAFHRVCPDPLGRSVAALGEALAAAGTVEPVSGIEAALPTRKGEVGVYCRGNWWRLTLDPVERPGVLAQLDAERMRRDVIGAVLGVDELAEGSGIDYIPSPAGLDEVIRCSDQDGRVGFFMYPTSVSDLMAVADAGELMPPKSSYVSPKPRSGIFLRVLGTGATSHLAPS